MLFHSLRELQDQLKRAKSFHRHDFKIRKLGTTDNPFPVVLACKIPASTIAAALYDVAELKVVVKVHSAAVVDTSVSVSARRDALGVGICNSDLPEQLRSRIADVLWKEWAALLAGDDPDAHFMVPFQTAAARFAELLGLLPELREPYEAVNEQGVTVRRFALLMQDPVQQRPSSTSAIVTDSGASKPLTSETTDASADVLVPPPSIDPENCAGHACHVPLASNVIGSGCEAQQGASEQRDAFSLAQSAIYPMARTDGCPTALNAHLPSLDSTFSCQSSQDPVHAAPSQPATDSRSIAIGAPDAAVMEGTPPLAAHQVPSDSRAAQQRVSAAQVSNDEQISQHQGFSAHGSKGPQVPARGPRILHRSRKAAEAAAKSLSWVTLPLESIPPPLQADMRWLQRRFGNVMVEGVEEQASMGTPWTIPTSAGPCLRVTVRVTPRDPEWTDANSLTLQTTLKHAAARSNSTCSAAIEVDAAKLQMPDGLPTWTQGINETAILQQLDAALQKQVSMLDKCYTLPSTPTMQHPAATPPPSSHSQTAATQESSAASHAQPAREPRGNAHSSAQQPSGYSPALAAVEQEHPGCGGLPAAQSRVSRLVPVMGPTVQGPSSRSRDEDTVGAAGKSPQGPASRPRVTGPPAAGAMTEQGPPGRFRTRGPSTRTSHGKSTSASTDQSDGMHQLGHDPAGPAGPVLHGRKGPAQGQQPQSDASQCKPRRSRGRRCRGQPAAPLAGPGGQDPTQASVSPLQGSMIARQGSTFGTQASEAGKTSYAAGPSVTAAGPRVTPAGPDGCAPGSVCPAPGPKQRVPAAVNSTAKHIGLEAKPQQPLTPLHDAAPQTPTCRSRRRQNPAALHPKPQPANQGPQRAQQGPPDSGRLAKSQHKPPSDNATGLSPQGPLLPTNAANGRDRRQRQGSKGPKAPSSLQAGSAESRQVPRGTPPCMPQGAAVLQAPLSCMPDDVAAPGVFNLLTEPHHCRGPRGGNPLRQQCNNSDQHGTSLASEEYQQTEQQMFSFPTTQHHQTEQSDLSLLQGEHGTGGGATIVPHQPQQRLSDVLQDVTATGQRAASVPDPTHRHEQPQVNEQAVEVPAGLLDQDSTAAQSDASVPTRTGLLAAEVQHGSPQPRARRDVRPSARPSMHPTGTPWGPLVQLCKYVESYAGSMLEQAVDAVLNSEFNEAQQRPAALAAVPQVHEDVPDEQQQQQLHNSVDVTEGCTDPVDGSDSSTAAKNGNVAHVAENNSNDELTGLTIIKRYKEHDHGNPQHTIGQPDDGDEGDDEVQCAEGAEGDDGCQVDGEVVELRKGMAAAAGAGAAQAAEGALRLQLRGLQLDNVDVVEPLALNIQVLCSRCSTAVDLQLRPDQLSPGQVTITAASPCTRCRAMCEVSFRPSLVHERSNSCGTLRCEGCTPLDLLPSLVGVQCSHCSRVIALRQVQVGQVNSRTCPSCHRAMQLQWQAVEFTPYDPRKAVGPQPAGSGRRTPSTANGPSGAPRPLLVGQPLPLNGTCKHYRHSHRWLRFPCCGKRFPCDVCHEEQTDGHQVKWATRMVCGYCSVEQPLAASCARCGKRLATSASNPSGRNTRFWEGGQGCRDTRLLDSRDVHKHRGRNKTQSKKAERVGAEGAARTVKGKAARAKASSHSDS